VSFELGQVVMTRAVAETVKEHPEFSDEIATAMARYVKGDWGDLGEEDAAMNDHAVIEKNDRILAKYKTSREALYIVTEWDRSSTCVMFVSDY